MQSRDLATRHAVLGGASIGLLWGVPAVALAALAERAWDLPSPAYAGFEWLSRVLPGRVITAGIDVMVRVIHALALGPTAAAAKRAEHALAIALFLALAMIFSALLGGLSARATARVVAASGVALGALLGAAPASRLDALNRQPSPGRSS
jgi:hypothetical protein